MLFQETLLIWCQGNPDSLSLCFGSSGESCGQGSNESRASQHSSIFSEFLADKDSISSGFDREVSCLDHITLFLVT